MHAYGTEPAVAAEQPVRGARDPHELKFVENLEPVRSSMSRAPGLKRPGDARGATTLDDDTNDRVIGRTCPLRKIAANDSEDRRVVAHLGVE